MLRRSRSLSLSFTTLTLALLTSVAGCGDDPPSTTGGLAQGGAGGTGGQGGGMGGQGGGGMGGQGGAMCVPEAEVCGDNTDNNCDGTIDEGCCALGTTQVCYSGPNGTEDIGACTAGVATCEPSGQFGGCVDEVLPAPETCNGIDDDCNNLVDDNPACVCVPGTAVACYDGPSGTAGVGQCMMGTAMCAADGQSLGPCMGQVLPAAETCNQLDDDCNAAVDNGIGCACAPGTSMPCYTGPDNTNGIGVCMSGTQACLPDGTGYAACIGDVVPSLDNCASPLDEDCSGQALLCTGNHVASKRLGDMSNQLGTDVAVDAQGNVYTVGSFEGTLDFGGAIGMLTSAGGFDVLVAKYDPMGNAIWAKRYGNASNQVGNAIAVDAAGNVFVTGSFQGTISFGPGTQTSAGGDDLFVAKLDTSGTQLWVRTLGNTATQQGMDISVDATGAAYVSGQYSGDVTFGGKIIVGVDGLDAILLKYSANGDALWGKGFAGIGTQFGYEVSATGSNQVTFVGAFQNNVDYGGGALTSAGDYDIVVARYDSFGTHQWSKRFGDAANQRALAVHVDSQGAVLFTGEFAGVMSLGGDTFTSADAAANVDGFVGKLDAMGNHVWSKKFGNMGAQRGTGIVADVFDNVALTGEFFGSIDLGNVPAVVSAGGRDAFVGKMNPSGTTLWLRRYGSGMMTSQQGEAIAAAPTTHLWVTGTFESTIDFGGGPFTSAGGTDMFLAKLAP